MLLHFLHSPNQMKEFKDYAALVAVFVLCVLSLLIFIFK